MIKIMIWYSRQIMEIMKWNWAFATNYIFKT